MISVSIRILLYRRLKRMLANPKLAPLFHYPASRTPGDGDIWDRKQMTKRKEEIGEKNVLELGFSSDSCVFQTWKKRAFTPNVCQMLNWPPGLRTCFGGMLLFAVFPPKVKNYYLFYTTVLEYNKNLWWKTAEGEGKGLLCYDAFLQKEVRWYMRVAWVLEDVRGMPNPTGSKQAPAIVGACSICGVRGSKLPNDKNNTTYYPGAICHCGDAELEVML